MSEKPLHEYIDLEVYDVVPGEQHRQIVEQLEALDGATEAVAEVAMMYKEQRDVLQGQVDALERFEDEVRDVMDFMPHDKHYEALNEALGRIRGVDNE